MTVATESRFVDVAGGRLFVQSWSPAVLHADHTPRAPIVLFHDSLGCVALWREFPALLAATTSRRVIAYDRLGFGQSSARHDVLAHSFVEDEGREVVPRLLTALGVETFVAMGHSVGGGMAVAAAAAHRARCTALITMAAQSFVEDRTVAGVREARASFAAPEQLARIARHHGDRAEWVLHAWVDTWLHPDFATWSLDALAEQVHCPALVIHSDNDEYGSLAHPMRLLRHLRGPSRQLTVPGGGHLPHRTEPAAVLNAVQDLLAPLV
ncbi:alpha/beta fold hydrolase [Gemmatimonas sp. UBA7669]|uniref:alpha/beta fold hydrolase n=1 Tax=Gemmatimonas sp. UBA7669 TaxID=1946568 RepID=UPI0025C6E032|nr:alpha/beta hydrolase [Gemmatimonas sp. UBA7669]